jgi:hypothetical protein
VKASVVWCFVPLLLSSCASTAPLVPNVSTKVGESPRLNEVVERSVGEVIYETYNYQEFEGAKLSELATVDVLAATWSLPAGEPLQAYVDGSTKIYCTREPALRVMGKITSRVCLADLDNNQRFDSWKAPQGPPARQKWNKLKNELGFSSGGAMTSTMGGFRYELLYQGISGNIVSLLYREYIDDLVRPAFQQDLSYTLAAEGATEVSFRGTRLRLLSADNNRIRYELLSGLAPR